MIFFKKDKNDSDVYALQRSELLDESTCNFCLSIDGRVFSVDDPLTKVDSFCHNCRGLWVEILKGEVEKPPIEGISNLLRNSFDKSIPFINLEKPIVKKDSLAEKYLKEQGRDYLIE